MNRAREEKYTTYPECLLRDKALEQVEQNTKNNNIIPKHTQQKYTKTMFETREKLS